MSRAVQPQTIVAAVVVHNGRVLLVRRRIAEGNLSWQFPAGAQQQGETPHQTAVREVAEEVGLTVQPVAVLGQRRHPTTGRHIVYVACGTETAAATVLDTDELAELAWCDHDTLVRNVLGLFEPVLEYLRPRLATAAGP
jgi:8-oxo-dGTP diphosphatase